MKVKAIKRGYFGGEYRLPGDVFDCPSEQAFSKRFDSLEIPSLEFPEVVNRNSPE